MSKIIIVLAILVASIKSYAQTIWYQGGKGDGTATMQYNAFILDYLTNYYPYFGGKNDGYATTQLNNFVSGLIDNYHPYFGGKDDGYATTQLINFERGLIDNYYPYFNGKDDGYATTQLINFERDLIDNYYPYFGGKNDGWAEAFGTSTFPLPLILLSFEGKNEGDHNNLYWKTILEKDIAEFTITKSEDGKNFKNIGKVKPSISSSNQNNYSYNDYKDIVGTKFYQLQMHSIDSSFVASRIVKIINERLDMVITLAPNPTKENITIRLSKSLSRNSPFSIFNLSGQLILQQNISKDEASKVVDLSKLPAGNYFIKLQLSNDVISMPFIKQ